MVEGPPPERARYSLVHCIAHGDHIIAVDLDTRHAERRPSCGDGSGDASVECGRNRDLVVLTDKHHGQIQDSGEIHGLVTIAAT